MTKCTTVAECHTKIEELKKEKEALKADKETLKTEKEELKAKKEELQAKVEKCRESSGPSTPRNNGPSAANASVAVPANVSANASGSALPSLDSMLGGRRSRKGRGRKSTRKGRGRKTMRGGVLGLVCNALGKCFRPKKNSHSHTGHSTYGNSKRNDEEANRARRGLTQKQINNVRRRLREERNE